jgi:hypothetical protein
VTVSAAITRWWNVYCRHERCAPISRKNIATPRERTSTSMPVHR